MRRRVQSWYSTVLPGAGILMMLFLPVETGATVHVIEFGGVLGNTYSPNILSVSVGDTIRWQGTFDSHPVRSTIIPAGAESWSNGSGTAFIYIVPLPGTYNYTCDFHGPSMSGSFTAAVSSLNGDTGSRQPGEYALGQNYPNPFNPTTTITYTLQGPQPARVKLAVYNLLSQEVAVLVNETQSAGSHTVTFNAAGLSSGIYLYTLTAAGIDRTRRMVLLR